jgi:hypothetical protein
MYGFTLSLGPDGTTAVLSTVGQFVLTRTIQRRKINFRRSGAENSRTIFVPDVAVRIPSPLPTT